jgi:DNA-binding winged helix-turn-helix (wHTH) protein/tetratricopeptide (TPR) repeat protein
MPPSAHIRFGSFDLDSTAGELRKSGIPIKLQPQPFRMLVLLLERAGQLVTREEIQRHLWSDSTFVDFERGINFSINQIRGALADNADKPRYIETLPRRGYRFIGVVENLPVPRQPSTPVMDSVGSVPDRKRDRVSGDTSVALHAQVLRWQILLPFTLTVAAFIGAFFFLHRVPLLTQKGTIVLADFTNSTGDAVFDSALRQGLSVQLGQSPFLSLMSDERVRETLSLMGQPVDARVTPQMARELCLRTQSGAVLQGSISSLGSQYVIGLDAVNCKTGDLLAQEQVQAARKEDVLKALGNASTNLRKKLGESLSTVEKFDTPIEQATTPSLEALAAYSLGQKALVVEGDYLAAVRWFENATHLDHNFAMAYAEQSAAYANLGENSLAIENTRKAYELRERVSKREKFYIEHHYYIMLLGDLVGSRQTLELWAQAYPRDSVPHFELGNLYDSLGQYERGLEEAREALRLDPGSGLTYAYLSYSYASLNRLDEAKAVAEEAQAKNLDSPALHITLYPLAFLRNDLAGMAQQVAWAAGKPGVEDVLLAMEADTAAYFGRLEKAGQLSRRAMASAEQEKEKETASCYEAKAALREALFGRPIRARQVAALGLSTHQVLEFVAGFALAVAHDTARAEVVAADMGRRFPKNTIVKFTYLPTIRAQIALNRNDTSKAIQTLQNAAYELGQHGGSCFVALYPVYVRGQSYLTARRGNEAAVEFRKILDHRSVVANEAIGPLAQLGLARAYALQGDTAKARAAYQDFLALWKDADPDIPVLQQAKAEYAKQQ